MIIKNPTDEGDRWLQSGCNHPALMITHGQCLDLQEPRKRISRFNRINIRSAAQ